MIACISPTNIWGILSSLSFSSKFVITNSIGCCCKSRESLEIQPQLANIIRNFLDGEGAGTSTGGSVGTGIIWVPDICGVG